MSDNERIDSFSYESLLTESERFQKLRRTCRSTVRVSLSGITNLVTNYEDPLLIDNFLQKCFKASELYKETYDIDAVELQRGSPGAGNSLKYLDSLIFGNFATKDESGVGVDVPVIDNQTGRRKRLPDGFVTRREVLTGEFTSKLLIIKGIDYCLDFCDKEPGDIDSAVMWLFENFRNPSVKQGCRLLLVSHTPLKFPFKIRMVKFDLVDDYSAMHIIESWIDKYRDNDYTVEISDVQKTNLARKLCGLNYTEAADVLSEALSAGTAVDPAIKSIDTNVVVKNLREKINSNLLGDSVGLTHLVAKPWEDYIHSESSSFTFDVEKILRDFKEINRLKDKQKKLLSKNKNTEPTEHTINAIRSRMPHVILLYGRGGVGKSAFPLHFAGLLDFDVWDFNINASHSK